MYEAALVLSAICLIGVTIYFVRMPAFSVFHPLTYYLLFHGFIFVFRPIVSYLSDFKFLYTLYQFTPSPADKLTVILGSNVGMLAFAFFCLQSGHAEMQFKQDRFAIEERNRLIPAGLWAIALAAPLGLYSLLWRWDRASQEINDMVMDKGTGIIINTATNGYLTEAQLMLAIACAILGWLFRFRLIALAPLIGFIILRAGTGGRGPFVIAAICLALLWLYEHRLKLPTPRLFIGALAVLALFTAIGNDRGRSVRVLFGDDNTLERENVGESLKWLEGMDFSNLEAFEFLVYAVPQRSGSYEYFADHLMLFTEPVPRVLWPGKPIGSPVKFFELYDYGYPVGMTRSLPGEGWTQLGWIGIIFWCGLWGWATGKYYDYFVRGRQSTFIVMCYLTFLSMLVVVYRDGTVMTLLRQGIFYYAPIAAWLFIANSLGVPMAVEERMKHLRKLRRLAKTEQSLPAASDTAPDTAPSATLTPAARRAANKAAAYLPPAVRRRHERLAALKLKPEG